MSEASNDTPVFKHRTVRGPSLTETKTDKVVKLLRRKNGATIADLQKATGWQAHSVRGLLSGTVRKRMGLDVTSQRPDGKERRYQILGPAS